MDIVFMHCGMVFIVHVANTIVILVQCGMDIVMIMSKATFQRAKKEFKVNKMSDEIIKLLDDLSERFGVVIDWSEENMLPYAQELFQKFTNYEIWTSALWLVIGAAIIVVAIIMTKKWWSDCDGKDCGVILIVTIPMMLIGSAFFFPQAIDIITALTFPEKLLFEYLNDIAK